MANTQITVYGADWCGDTTSTLNTLDTLGIPYRYINIDEDPDGKQWVMDKNGGKQKTPTVDIAGQILSVPDETELEEALSEAGIMG